MCSPLLPLVLGCPTPPISSSIALTSPSGSRIMSKLTPGVGSRSMRSSSAWSRSAAFDGQTWKPRQPRFTAQITWAMSAITSASDVVPFGVDTVAVASHSGGLLGTRFWKKDLPLAPSGNRWRSTGRPPIAAMIGSSTAR